MGTDSLRDLADVFSRRFVLNALLPTLVFATVCTSVIVSTPWSLTSASAWWGRLDLLTRLIVIVGYLAGVFFLAAATASQWRGIVRLYEGYPISWLARKLGTTAVGVDGTSRGLTNSAATSHRSWTRNGPTTAIHF